MNNPPTTRTVRSFCRCQPGCLLAVILCFFAGRLGTDAQPFTVQGPGVNTNDFRVTTFASGLNFPMGMAKLSDDSLLVTISEGSSYFTSTGRLVRFTDTNSDGIADGPGTVLYTSPQGTLTDVCVMDNLIFVIGRPHPITVLRANALPSDPSVVGQIIINYTNRGANGSHGASVLAARKSPGYENRYDLVFHLGSTANTSVGNSQVLTNNNIPGAHGSIAAAAIHMITLIDDGTGMTATNLTQLASGVRNGAGLAFHPVTGDLYFQDNGIDGSNDEPVSADELNFLARTNFGGPVEFYGFPANYSAYRNNGVIGGAGIQPLIAFRPLPNPANGSESEGANQITFAPPGFPDGLNSGVFVGFHGKYNVGGIANEENPLIHADPATGNYFHFIRGRQTGIGHLDGLLATRDSLFVADLSTNGVIFSADGSGRGAIYQIKSLVTPAPPMLTADVVDGQIQLTWDRGALQAAEQINGPWANVADAFSPHLIQPTDPRKFFRTRY